MSQIESPVLKNVFQKYYDFFVHLDTTTTTTSSTPCYIQTSFNDLQQHISTLNTNDISCGSSTAATTVAAATASSSSKITDNLKQFELSKILESPRDVDIIVQLTALSTTFVHPIEELTPILPENNHLNTTTTTINHYHDHTQELGAIEQLLFLTQNEIDHLHNKQQRWKHLSSIQIQHNDGLLSQYNTIVHNQFISHFSDIQHHQSQHSHHNCDTTATTHHHHHHHHHHQHGKHCGIDDLYRYALIVQNQREKHITNVSKELTYLFSILFDNHTTTTCGKYEIEHNTIITQLTDVFGPPVDIDSIVQSNRQHIQALTNVSHIEQQQYTVLTLPSHQMQLQAQISHHFPDISAALLAAQHTPHRDHPESTLIHALASFLCVFCQLVVQHADQCPVLFSLFSAIFSKASSSQHIDENNNQQQLGSDHDNTTALNISNNSQHTSIPSANFVFSALAHNFHRFELDEFISSIYDSQLNITSHELQWNWSQWNEFLSFSHLYSPQQSLSSENVQTTSHTMPNSDYNNDCNVQLRQLYWIFSLLCVQQNHSLFLVQSRLFASHATRIAQRSIGLQLPASILSNLPHSPVHPDHNEKKNLFPAPSLINDQLRLLSTTSHRLHRHLSLLTSPTSPAPGKTRIDSVLTLELPSTDDHSVDDSPISRLRTLVAATHLFGASNSFFVLPIQFEPTDTRITHTLSVLHAQRRTNMQNYLSNFRYDRRQFEHILMSLNLQLAQSFLTNPLYHFDSSSCYNTINSTTTSAISRVIVALDHGKQQHSTTVTDTSPKHDQSPNNAIYGLSPIQTELINTFTDRGYLPKDDLFAMVTSSLSQRHHSHLKSLFYLLQLGQSSSSSSSSPAGSNSSDRWARQVARLVESISSTCVFQIPYIELTDDDNNNNDNDGLSAITHYFSLPNLQQQKHTPIDQNIAEEQPNNNSNVDITDTAHSDVSMTDNTHPWSLLAAAEFALQELYLPFQTSMDKTLEHIQSSLYSHDSTVQSMLSRPIVSLVPPAWFPSISPEKTHHIINNVLRHEMTAITHPSFDLSQCLANTQRFIDTAIAYQNQITDDQTTFSHLLQQNSRHDIAQTVSSFFAIYLSFRPILRTMPADTNMELNRLQISSCTQDRSWSRTNIGVESLSNLSILQHPVPIYSVLESLLDNVVYDDKINPLNHNLNHQHQWLHHSDTQTKMSSLLCAITHLVDNLMSQCSDDNVLHDDSDALNDDIDILNDDSSHNSSSNSTLPDQSGSHTLLEHSSVCTISNDFELQRLLQQPTTFIDLASHTLSQTLISELPISHSTHKIACLTLIVYNYQQLVQLYDMLRYYSWLCQTGGFDLTSDLAIFTPFIAQSHTSSSFITTLTIPPLDPLHQHCDFSPDVVAIDNLADKRFLSLWTSHFCHSIDSFVHDNSSIPHLAHFEQFIISFASQMLQDTQSLRKHILTVFFPTNEQEQQEQQQQEKEEEDISMLFSSYMTIAKQLENAKHSTQHSQHENSLVIPHIDSAYSLLAWFVLHSSQIDSFPTAMMQLQNQSSDISSVPVLLQTLLHWVEQDIVSDPRVQWAIPSSSIPPNTACNHSLAQQSCSREIVPVYSLNWSICNSQSLHDDTNNILSENSPLDNQSFLHIPWSSIQHIDPMYFCPPPPSRVNDNARYHFSQKFASIDPDISTILPSSFLRLCEAVTTTTVATTTATTHISPQDDLFRHVDCTISHVVDDASMPPLVAAAVTEVSDLTPSPSLEWLIPPQFLRNHMVFSEIVSLRNLATTQLTSNRIFSAAKMFRFIITSLLSQIDPHCYDTMSSDSVPSCTPTITTTTKTTNPNPQPPMSHHLLQILDHSELFTNPNILSLDIQQASKFLSRFCDEPIDQYLRRVIFRLHLTIGSNLAICHSRTLKSAISLFQFVQTTAAARPTSADGQQQPQHPCPAFEHLSPKDYTLFHLIQQLSAQQSVLAHLQTSLSNIDPFVLDLTTTIPLYQCICTVNAHSNTSRIFSPYSPQQCLCGTFQHTFGAIISASLSSVIQTFRYPPFVDSDPTLTPTVQTQSGHSSAQQQQQPQRQNILWTKYLRNISTHFKHSFNSLLQSHFAPIQLAEMQPHVARRSPPIFYQQDDQNADVNSTTTTTTLSPPAVTPHPFHVFVSSRPNIHLMHLLWLCSSRSRYFDEARMSGLNLLHNHVQQQSHTSLIPCVEEILHERNDIPIASESHIHSINPNINTFQHDQLVRLAKEQLYNVHQPSSPPFVSNSSAILTGLFHLPTSHATSLFWNQWLQAPRCPQLPAFLRPEFALYSHQFKQQTTSHTMNKGAQHSFGLLVEHLRQFPTKITDYLRSNVICSGCFRSSSMIQPNSILPLSPSHSLAEEDKNENATTEIIVKREIRTILSHIQRQLHLSHSQAVQSVESHVITAMRVQKNSPATNLPWGDIPSYLHHYAMAMCSNVAIREYTCHPLFSNVHPLGRSSNTVVTAPEVVQGDSNWSTVTVQPNNTSASASPSPSQKYTMSQTEFEHFFAHQLQIGNISPVNKASTAFHRNCDNTTNKSNQHSTSTRKAFSSQFWSHGHFSLCFKLFSPLLSAQYAKLWFDKQFPPRKRHLFPPAFWNTLPPSLNACHYTPLGTPHVYSTFSPCFISPYLSSKLLHYEIASNAPSIAKTMIRIASIKYDMFHFKQQYGSVIRNWQHDIVKKRHVISSLSSSSQSPNVLSVSVSDIVDFVSPQNHHTNTINSSSSSLSSISPSSEYPPNVSPDTPTISFDFQDACLSNPLMDHSINEILTDCRSALLFIDNMIFVYSHFVFTAQYFNNIFIAVRHCGIGMQFAAPSLIEMNSKVNIVLQQADRVSSNDEIDDNEQNPVCHHSEKNIPCPEGRIPSPSLSCSESSLVHFQASSVNIFKEIFECQQQLQSVQPQFAAPSGAPKEQLQSHHDFLQHQIISLQDIAVQQQLHPFDLQSMLSLRQSVVLLYTRVQHTYHQLFQDKLR